MRSTLVGVILAFGSVAATRRVEAQAERIRTMVNTAQADKSPCLKTECLRPWQKLIPTPNGTFIVTRCATSPSQQIDLGLAARAMARETGNDGWNELAITAVASAFIHDPDSYSVVQASPPGVITELDARLSRGEYGSTLRPGGAKDFLALAAKWSAQPQCVR